MPLDFASFPDPVEIAAGAWQLLPLTEADFPEIAALDLPAADRERLAASAAATDGPRLGWTIRTAVGGFIDGVIIATFDGQRASVATTMTPTAPAAAASTARGAVSRYVAACGFDPDEADHSPA